jgi:hypothetical protein
MKEAFNALGVSGVWIIEKDSGLTLLCHEAKATIPGTIFGGLLTAIRGLMTEIQIGQLSSISTDTHDLILTISDNIISAIILESDSSTECLYPLLVRINEKAEEHYLKMQQKISYVDTDFFNQFSQLLKEITTSHLEYMRKHCESIEEKEPEEKAEDKLEKAGLW